MKTGLSRADASSKVRMFGFALLLLLAGAALVTLGLRPAEAQSASITEVVAPSIVRAGETFFVSLLGDYETSGPMTFWVNIIDSNGWGWGSGFYEVSMEAGDGSIHVGKWSIVIPIEACMPSPDEYDDEGRFLWELTAHAVYPASGDYPFAVTIIRPDAAPYVKILQATPYDLNEVDVESASIFEAEPSTIYTGSVLVFALKFECSIPEDAELKLLYKNSLEKYPVGTSFEGDWACGPFLGGGSGVGVFPFYGGAVFEPVDEWVWDFRVVAETAEGETVEDAYSASIEVLERADRSAFISDVSSSYPVLRAEEFNVAVIGGYVFPEGATGDLHLKIVYAESGGTVPGGEEVTMAGLTGGGPFTQAFTLTAPDAEGHVEMMAVLTMSDNPGFREEYPFTVHVGAGVMEDFFLRITGIRVNGAEPPQEVNYGESFTVQIEVSWRLPADAHADIVLWDWDSITLPIALETFTVPAEEGSQTVDIVVDDHFIPARNGPWTLRASARYWAWGMSDFTPDGYERTFQVTVAGAEEPGGEVSDWRIDALWASPMDPFMGGAVSFRAGIGVDTTSAHLPLTVEVAYALDGVEQLRDTVTYEGGDFLAVDSPPWTPTPGGHTIRWEVDPDGLYADPNRANNVAELAFTVSETPPMPQGWEPTPEEEQEEFDFYLTVTPSEQVLASSITYAVSVEKVSGPPNPVQIEVEGLPPSVSYRVEPTSGNPDPRFSATLTLTSGSTVPAGTYRFEIKAISGGVERRQPASFVVREGPDYRIDVEPRTLRAYPGDALECTVRVSSGDGYDRLVNLMLSGPPQGVTFQLHPRSGTPDFQSTLRVSVAEDAPPGAHTLTLTGSGPNPKQVSITLFIRERTATTTTKATKGGEQPLDYYLPLSYILVPLAAVIIGASLAVRRIRARKASSERFCIECGKPIPLQVRFCPQCGAQQKE